MSFCHHRPFVVRPEHARSPACVYTPTQYHPVLCAFFLNKQHFLDLLEASHSFDSLANVGFVLVTNLHAVTGVSGGVRASDTAGEADSRLESCGQVLCLQHRAVPDLGVAQAVLDRVVAGVVQQVLGAQHGDGRLRWLTRQRCGSEGRVGTFSPAIVPASSSAALRTAWAPALSAASCGSMTRERKPSLCASAAPKSAPVNASSRSLESLLKTCWARWRVPKSAASPIATSLMLKLADELASRTSHAHAMSTPPPIHGPCIAATTGLLHFAIALTARWSSSMCCTETCT